ncbi:MAG: sigma factor-like helix-turn-helix DNA-binding protein [Patescibacteria group bacterium]|nr:sigma factor-like helix-turn-helix DNA-binding protein [Patescibacteria group bacterium]
MPKEEEVLGSEGEIAVEGEEIEPIKREDRVSEKEKEAFREMQRRAKLDRRDVSEDSLLREELEIMIETLSSEKEKEVIRRRFFLGETPEEIAKDIGTNKGRILEIEARVLRKLRHPKRWSMLEDEYERDRYRYSYILSLVNDQYHDYSKFKQNEEMGELLDRFRKAMSYLYTDNKCNLDSTILNNIFDKVEAILNKFKYNKGKYSNQDVNDLKNIVERLEKIKGQK